MTLLRFEVDVPIVRHGQTLPVMAQFEIKSSSSRVHVDRWLAQGKIHAVTHQPMQMQTKPVTVGLFTGGPQTRTAAESGRNPTTAAARSSKNSAKTNGGNSGPQSSIVSASAGLDELLRKAIAAAGVKDEAAFKRLPREEQNAFLAQARGADIAKGNSGSREIRLAEIDRSTTNREQFDVEKMAELVASVRLHGVMEPIIVRPKGERFEIVMGERRWLAAQEVGLAAIPALVRDLDDRSALEWQLTENLQREDLRPMDEARGYQQMIALGYSVDDLVKKLNRGKSSIYGRLKLLELPEDAAKAVEAGTLPASHAELLTTFDDPKAQARLAKAMLAPKEIWTGGKSVTREVVSFREAKALADEESKKADKEKAWQEASAEYREDGCQVLSLSQSGRVFQYGSLKAGYVSANDKCDLDPQGRTWKALLTKLGDEGKAIVAHNDYGTGPKLRVVFERKTAEKILVDGGLMKARPAGVSPQTSRDQAAEHRKQQLAREAEKRERRIALEGVTIGKVVAAAEARELSADVLRMIADEMNGEEKTILRRRGMEFKEDDWSGPKKAMDELIEKADAKTLRGLLVECLLWDYNGADAAALKALAGIYKVRASGNASAKAAPAAKKARSKGLTPAARARLAAAMKARWAARKNGPQI